MIKWDLQRKLVKREVSNLIKWFSLWTSDDWWESLQWSVVQISFSPYTPGVLFVCTIEQYCVLRETISAVRLLVGALVSLAVTRWRWCPVSRSGSSVAGTDPRGKAWAVSPQDSSGICPYTHLQKHKENKA